MASCVICGKRVGLFEQLVREIQDDPEGICTSCHPEFKKNIVEELKECKSEEDFDNFLDRITASDYSASGHNYIVKYVTLAKKQNATAAQVANLSDRVQSILDKHKLTTGESFEGFDIKKYHGVISGDAVMGTGFTNELSASFDDLFGAQSNTFARKMVEVRDAAKQRLIIESAKRGGNAVVGVNFDYVTFAGNMIGVFANGTSVTIEKSVPQPAVSFEKL